ncbi:MAG TPA: MarC family transcriptional regulator, partial [Cytophagales bacterium]|nr:MarC family transcriptional regulator [Cytophagales bacterium]
VVLLTMGILMVAGRIQRVVGEYGITVISKVMGLILAAYGVQSILTGIKAYFFTGP